MAYFAKMNGAVVEQIVVVRDADAPTEEAGVQFCKTLFGPETVAIECKRDGVFRKQFPAPGDTYNSAADVFVAARPWPSWTLDENHEWQPPIPRPEGKWVWSEDDLTWLYDVDA